MERNSLRYETLQVHAGHQPDDTTLSRAVPIYQTSSYIFRDAAHAASLFSLEEPGNIYTRINNPTTEVLEKRVAALENGVAALAVASGHAAQFIALTTFMGSGDNLISSPWLYGGTHNQFRVSLQRLGIEVRFTSSLEPDEIESKADEKTKAIYVETIGNPSFQIPDFNKIAAVAEKLHVPLIVDNTFGACGYLFRPLDHGADIVVESATKWIGGHGNSIGGIIVDAGRFAWNADNRFPLITEPSEGYHGIKYCDLFETAKMPGATPFIVKARVEGLRDFGPSLSPFNSFLLLQGLETLSLRMERHISNTLALAEWLEKHPLIKRVSYPGLKSSPQFSLAQKYLPSGAGGVLSFETTLPPERSVRLVEHLDLVSHLANVGDTRTLIIQPSRTTHAQLTAEEREKAGIPESLFRVSVGIEHIDDIIADFEQALNAL
ncbi:MAG: O-acetylhomoserine aminocarboxypropyltransferase/cysteine synthase [Bacteroidales bacterium]|nr:O-acetylhomoserine aminocarboxypropyltransferase/cysteine synthase [Bacteroidales bacterium]